MHVQAVIGAGFGDEGKGRTVDFLTEMVRIDSMVSPLVARFNGGAQASHTVVHPTRTLRHVFHHFGSGTMLGAPTFLTKHFIVNPEIAVREHNDLISKGLRPKLIIDREATLTTPFDVLINQIVERVKGHGSCGIGIHETVNRSKIVPIRFGDTPEAVRKWATYLLESFWPENRLKQFNIEPSDEFLRIINNPRLIDDFVDYFKALRSFAILSEAGCLRLYEYIIFEGAQGLLLDQDNDEFFPHVTCSKTGLTNVAETLKDAQLDHLAIEAFYCIRSYMTRHGNGPFPTEFTENLRYADDTNISNEWQGDLRFGELDRLRIKAAIDKDLQHYKHVNPRLVVGHLDQRQISMETIEEIGINPGYYAFGPTSEDMTKMPGVATLPTYQ